MRNRARPQFQPRLHIPRPQLTALLHPELAEMVYEDSLTSGKTASWVLNDAVATYYRMRRLSSTYIGAQRRASKEEK